MFLSWPRFFFFFFFFSLARLSRAFSFRKSAFDALRTLLSALLNRSAGVSPGTFGAGSGFMHQFLASAAEVADLSG